MPKDFVPVPLSELKTLTNGEFYDDEFSKGRYSTDASIYQIQPLAVFIPKSKDDVIKAVNFCLNRVSRANRFTMLNGMNLQSCCRIVWLFWADFGIIATLACQESQPISALF